jgi:5-bromo-4-chloroindolyl phosphate hydrolysis protein
LKRYIENDASKDAATAAEDGTDMKYLKRLLEEAARDLDRFEKIETSAYRFVVLESQTRVSNFKGSDLALRV